jgi:hypothetical protein
MLRNIVNTYRGASYFQESTAAYGRGELKLALDFLERAAKLRKPKARELVFKACILYFSGEHEDAVVLLKEGSIRLESDKSNNPDEKAYLQTYIHMLGNEATKVFGVKDGDWPSPVSFQRKNIRDYYFDIFQFD